MPDNSTNNKRIAKNTFFLYLRMIVVMAIGLYTVRAILDLLGVVDYGIYNVVGGVVGMFQFLNGTLATSSQRYFSIELAKGDMKRLNLWFCLNITTFSLFIVVFLVIAETIGLWFVNTQMTIPADRLFAANVVYQLSIISFCISFFNVPYNALIIAHEKMSAFAYISIVEAFLKLGIVFVLTFVTWDKLIVYGILMFLTSLGITSSYIIYNRRHFEESSFRPYWNLMEFKELLGFSGWHFLGTFSVVVRSQGINILLNIFFNPAVNAARAVAFQIYHAISQLSNNFFIAIKPQIYKLYASERYNDLYKLVIRSTVICSYLVSILVFPILANTHFVLDIWLKDVPNYTIVFTQLVLINGLIDSTNGPTTAAVLATGKIRNYELIVATLSIMNLPISYIALKLGGNPTVTMIISIILSFIITFVRAFILCRKTGFKFYKYFIAFIKLIISSIIISIIVYITIYNKSYNIISFVVHSLFVLVVCSIVYLYVALDKKDVLKIKNVIVEKIKK